MSTRKIPRVPPLRLDGAVTDDLVAKVNAQVMAVDNDPLVRHALNEIYSTYGVSASVEEKKKSLNKFGRNPNVGTGEHAIWWTGQDDDEETYVAANTNSIDSISSSNELSDVGLALKVEGHTETAGAKTFVVQSVTLDGTDGRTRVALTTPLNRITRAYITGSTGNTGEIFVYENTALTAGKPTDTTKIHLTVPAGKNQSAKATTSLSGRDYWIITELAAGYDEKTGSNTADVELQVRESGGVYRPKAEPLVIQTGGFVFQELRPYIIAPANSDIRLIATSSTTSQDITGGIYGFLAIDLAQA